MPTNSESRPPAKGVEFSDHLIVLGASQPHHSHSPRYCSIDQDEATPFHTSPSLPYRAPGKRRARFFEHPPELISDDKLTPPRTYDEPVETSCTDSEEDHSPHPKPSLHKSPPPLEQTIERCTRINTKLNSLPSGGAFSLMNSSEDVDLSSSDDEQLSASRKLIRVHGSAKLSTASGLDEHAFHIDDDEFAIEGAEKVDEEEAVNVRSFGRSFARVCLKEDLEDGEDMDNVNMLKPTTWRQGKSQVAFDVPDDQKDAVEKPWGEEAGVTNDSASAISSPSTEKKALQRGFTESRSAPPRRKSRLRLTFVRRGSVAERKEAKPDPNGRGTTADNVLNESLSGATRLSCFPVRRAPTKPRIKSGDTARPGMLCTKDTGMGLGGEAVDGAHQVVAIPEFDIENRKSSRGRKSRKMVKNVSMQRDDWIDFATNSPHRQRSQWLSRLISPSGGGSEISSRRDSRGSESEMRAESRNGSGVWRLLRFWSRKQ